MKKCLITGGTGFVGTYLRSVLSQHYDVYSSSRSTTQSDTKVIQLNLADYPVSKKILTEHQFDVIYHLAGQSSIHQSFQNAFETMNGNVDTYLHLTQILDELKKPVRFIFASSADIYEKIPDVIDESCPLNPNNPYGISKLFGDNVTRYLARNPNFNTTSLRLFNHTGPGQSDHFVIGSLTKQVAEIKLGLKPKQILVGNLKVERDFVDVRDVCRAYALVGQSDSSNGKVYNVCSGKAHRVEDLLNKIIHISGQKIEVCIDPAKVRPLDVPRMVGSYKLIEKDLGWKPLIPIEQTLEEMLDGWMKKLQHLS
jgi:GDP-4-dehydro-6-deoxy-D-mannose reductase